MKTVNIAIIGLGNISGIYLKNITTLFREIKVIGVYDLNRERMGKVMEEYDIPKSYHSLDDLLSDPHVDIVLNLTRPCDHYEITKQCLKAGKHVYSEKPLAVSAQQGKELLQLAQEQHLLVGCAPDTFMGAGLQTCRKLIEDGYIGTTIGVSGCMVCHGHEHWHPDPFFYYQEGGGPLFDMGPYYLTAMVNLLGCVSSVFSMNKTSFSERKILSQPHYGEIIDVKVPTYVTGMMRFESGVIGTLFMTFDVYSKVSSSLEIYGTEGTLYLPDPNEFGGPVKILRAGSDQICEMPLLFPYQENSRGLGLADMAHALQTGESYRANIQMAYHVLEVMDSFFVSAEKHEEIQIESRF